MNDLKYIVEQSRLGFREGWSLFWLPIAAVAAIVKTYSAKIKLQQDQPQAAKESRHRVV